MDQKSRSNWLCYNTENVLNVHLDAHLAAVGLSALRSFR